MRSEEEDWSCQATAAGASRKELERMADWIHEEGCRRLGAGGSAQLRSVVLYVSAHFELVPAVDESTDIVTRFPPLIARLVLEHLFTEAMRLIWVSHAT